MSVAQSSFPPRLLNAFNNNHEKTVWDMTDTKEYSSEKAYSVGSSPDSAAFKFNVDG